MHIALLCATARGCRFLQKLCELSVDDEITVCSFREDPWEPPFFDQAKAIAAAHGARFIEAKNAYRSDLRKFWNEHPADLLLAVSWRYMVPPALFRRARVGAYVFHDSCLPEYRGFSPTVWAIVNGEDHTGTTLFKMEEDVDSGDIVDQRHIPIGETDTIAMVMEEVTAAYLSILEGNFQALRNGTSKLQAQNHSKATYCCKRTLEDNGIDWSRSAREIHNLVRAVTDPYPGAHTTVNGQKLTVWSAEIPAQAQRYVGRIPGRVVKIDRGGCVEVLTNDGPIVLETVQFEGGEKQPAGDLIRTVGATLGN